MEQIKKFFSKANMDKIKRFFMLKKTNFEKVCLFNKAFGVKSNYSEPQLDICDKDPELIKYRLSLIQEEVQELQDAIKDKDFIEITDALADILYVTYGAFTAIGINADEAFEIVQKSNLSKLCATEQDAIETVKRYKEEVSQRYDSPSYRRSDDGKFFVVYNQSTMKILKNYKYTPADFTELLKN